jgi:hypothetical protein
VSETGVVELVTREEVVDKVDKDEDVVVLEEVVDIAPWAYIPATAAINKTITTITIIKLREIAAFSLDPNTLFNPKTDINSI